MLKGMKQMAKGVMSVALAGAVAITSLPVSVLAAPETVAGGYEIDMERLPKVHFSKHKDWETLYETAWQSHKSNITAVTKALNPELTTDDATAYYVDEAFDNRIFQWDTLFMMMFDKYGIHEFPTLNSMDNFYYHQTDSNDDSDGYISRMIYQGSGQSYYGDYQTVDAINPPMFAWAEWEQYQIHGDISRFTKKVKGKAIIDRLDAYWQFLKRTRTHKSGPAEGLYVSNGQGNGLDNTPNQDWSGWGQAANDMSIQQGQAADYIVRILDEVLAKDESLTTEDRTKYQEMKEKYQQEEADLKQIIQEKLWSQDGGFFFNADAETSEFTNIATPTGLWALAAGVATEEQADRMIEEYALNSNKMFRPNGLATVCYDYSTFKPTGGYWNGAMWSPTSYQWIKGLQKYGYDELAFKEAVRHINGLADVCVRGAYDRNGNLLHTLWENYSSEYSIPGSTEFSDTEPSRSNFVGWAGALGIGSVLEDLAGITIKGNENAIEWNIKLTEAFGVENLYFNGAEGENFVNLFCSERVNDTSGAKLTVKADHGFELRVKIGGKSQTIQAEAGEHEYFIEGTDGNPAYLGIRTSKNAEGSFAAERIEAADSAVLFGEEGTSVRTDGLPNQMEKGNKKIFNVNTVGYYRTNSKYPTNLRDSQTMQTLGAENAKEYTKTTSPHGGEGFMFMVPASNTMQTAKALIGVKNGTAKVEADLMDASQVTKTAELEGGEEETVYAVEIPNCASKDTDMMVTVTMEQEGKEPGEISLKAIVLEEGGREVLEAPVQVKAESGNAALLVSAAAPEGISYDSYRIYYKMAEENTWNVTDTEEFPCKVEGLTNYKRYDVFVTGIKDGAESTDSKSVSEIPEEVKRTDAQRAYYDWLALQAVTVKETEESIPVPEAEDTQVVLGSHTAPETVNLTEEGSADWKLFTATDLEQIEKKAGGIGIANLSAIQTVTKLNGNSCDTTFSFKDGTNNASGSYSKGIVFEQAGNGIAFDLPYSVRKQNVGIHLGAWSAKVKISASVVKGGETVKKYAEYFDTGAQAGGTPAKYGMISMEYLLEDADSVLHVEISNDTLYDKNWGNFNLAAITLGSSFYVSAEDMENGSILITNPIASSGETVTVFAAADEGYKLAEGSLKYYTKDDGNGTEIEDGAFMMPAGDVTVKAEFVKEGTADKEALNAAIERTKGLKEGDYTAESWAEMQKALMAAQALAGKEDAAQEEVDAAAQALSEAIRNLEVKDITGSGLLSVVYHAYARLDVSAYTAESAQALTDALAKAEAVLDKEASEEEERAQAASDILAAAAGLVLDTSDLSAAIAAADEAAKAANTVAQQALAQAAANKEAAEAAQATAEAAQKAAEAAQAQAAAAEKNAKKSMLTIVYNAYKDMNTSGYTEESANALRASLTAAAEVLRNEDADSAAFVQATESIMKAAADLAADTSDLEAAAAAAQAAAEAAQQVADQAKAQAAANKQAAELAAQAAAEADRKAAAAEQAAAEAKAELERAQQEAAAQKAELERLKEQAEAAQKAAEEARKKAEAAEKAALEAKAQFEEMQKQLGTADKPEDNQPIQAGKTYDNGNYFYKVTDTEKLTAEVTGIKNDKLTKITVYNTVVLGGRSYRITAVAAGAFKGNMKAASAVIGKNVETIGDGAFEGCTKLKKVTMNGTKLTQIGEKAFAGCKKLKNITIKSKGLKKAGKNAFKGIYKKAVIKVPAAKYKTYRKLLAKKGQSTGVKIKK
mgnify:CR=1 FL=1